MTTNITSVSYRKLDGEDAEKFKALRIEASSDSPSSIYPDVEELSRMSISDIKEQIIPSEFQSVYGAFASGELIGIAGIRRDAMRKIRHRAMIWGIYTKPSHRGQGIARGLMRILLDDVRASGEVSMLYLSVHSQNTAAKALYRSMGFSAYGLLRQAMLVDGESVDEELMDLQVQETT